MGTRADVATTNQTHSYRSIRHIVAPPRDLLAIGMITRANSWLETLHYLGNDPYPLNVGWRWDFVRYSQSSPTFSRPSDTSDSSPIKSLTWMKSCARFCDWPTAIVYVGGNRGFIASVEVEGGEGLASSVDERLNQFHAVGDSVFCQADAMQESLPALTGHWQFALSDDVGRLRREASD